jgi:putative hydrolase of the HAD superfamily
MSVRVVVFDWGGTLSVFADVDLLDMWRLAARRLDREQEDALTDRLARLEATMWADTAHSRRSFTLPDILRRASAELGLDVSELVLEEAALHHLDAWTPHIAHRPDAAQCLAGLRERGIRTVVLSNTHWPRAVHRHFLERDGLAELLDAEVYSSELSVVKPHPEAFRAALQSVGCTDPAEAVMVGDRLFDDIHGAQSLGMRAVFVPHSNVPSYEVEPDAVVDELSDLLPIVDAWNAA